MKLLLSILTLLIVTSGNAVADTSPRKLSLKEAIGMALEQNSLVKAAGHSAAAARQGIAAATSRYYPGLFFEESFAASNAPTQTFMMKLDEGRFSQNDFLINNLNHPGTHHDFKTALTLQLPLFDPSTAPLREIAVTEAEKGEIGLEASRERTAFEVFRTYLEVQKGAARRTAAEQAMEEARENVRLAGVRSAVGTGLKSDELRARTHLAAMESQLITAANNLDLARMRLALAVGLTSAEPVDTAGTVPEFTPPLQVDTIVKEAYEKRSDMRQARAETDRADAAVSLARGAYLPSVGAFASYQMNAEHTPFGSDNDAWMAGVSLKWQLFDGFRRCSERDRAAALRSAAAAQLEQTEKETAYRVRESLMRKEEMRKRLEVARHALQDAVETVRLLSRRFENSLATMAELLDAQTALNQARAGLVESEADLTLASGQIYYTSGTFIKESTR